MQFVPGRPASSLLAVACAVSLVVSTTYAQPPLAGDEFRVNAHTTADQSNASVAATASGDFVIVWQSDGQVTAAAGLDVFARRFGRDGVPSGTEFQVNDFTTGAQTLPRVATSGSGSFFVVWADEGRDGDGSGVYGRCFDSDAMPLGEEFRLSSTPAAAQGRPRVSSDAGGNVVVVWFSEPTAAVPNPDGSDAGVFARRLDAQCEPISADFQVNVYTTGSQSHPDVAHDAAGGFVVAWQSPAPDDTMTEIRARRFDADGNAMGDEIAITQAYADRAPRVAAEPDGGFLLAWDNAGTPDGRDGSRAAVLAQRFDSVGSPAGTLFQVNTYTTDAQRLPAVAADAGGRFVVVWESTMQASETQDIIGRRYRAGAKPLGGELKIDAFDRGGQHAPEVAWLGGEGFVVVWHGAGADGEYSGVFGRLLEDTFEAGPSCGDADESGRLTATDALIALRTAVGTSACAACVCDVNRSGAVAASDALAILQAAVGQAVVLDCVACV